MTTRTIHPGRRPLEWPATPLSVATAAETARRFVGQRDVYRALVRAGASAPSATGVVELLGSVVIGGTGVKVKDSAGAAIEVAYSQIPLMVSAEVGGLYKEVWWRTKTTEAGDDVLVDEVAP